MSAITVQSPWERGVKVNVEVDCTPEEARRFLGLPDVSKANDVYVDALTKAMQGVGSFEQLQEYAKQIAPMGQMGMQFIQQFLEGGFAGGLGSSGKRKGSA
jgi:hypothetical protein